jgi:hypothetical protein
MSTGRHAKKRAAQAEERLAKEQEQLLAKEEVKKGAQEKDLESQRIATMRARFGGQAPEVVGDQGMVPGGDNPQMDKSKMPNRFQKRDQFTNTFLGMNLDDAVGSTQGMDRKIKRDAAR